ncbi:MAG: hypothetical protein HY608_09190 [Planctomycetes bacterium]|nr:hypothetical protein [Planctomycetota bacterium]
MTTKTLERVYENLTARERCSLIVQAGIRGDEEERERLVRSASSGTYLIADYASYANAFTVVRSFAIEAQLELAAEFWRHVARFESARPTADDPASEEAVQQASDLMLVYAYMLTTWADGWRMFCSELGIDAEALGEAAGETDVRKTAEDMARQTMPTPEGAIRILQRLAAIETGTDRAGTAEDVAVLLREVFDKLGKNR